MLLLTVKLSDSIQDAAQHVKHMPLSQVWFLKSLILYQFGPHLRGDNFAIQYCALAHDSFAQSFRRICSSKRSLVDSFNTAVLYLNGTEKVHKCIACAALGGIEGFHLLKNPPGHRPCLHFRDTEDHSLFRRYFAVVTHW